MIALMREKKIEAVQIAFASLLIALFAQIRIPISCSPVPITGQTLGVKLTGAYLGSRNGVWAVLLYLFEGSIGLPFWAGGKSGLVSMCGPSFGYFLGFIIQAYLVGWIFERIECNWIKSMGAMLFAGAVQLIMGAMWLSQYVGVESMFVVGILPYIPGEIIKSGIATLFRVKYDSLLSR